MSTVRGRGAPRVRRRAIARLAFCFGVERRESGRWESGKPAFGFPLFHPPSSSELWECGNLACSWRDLQGARGKSGKPAFGFPRFPQPRHFHSSLVSRSWLGARLSRAAAGQNLGWVASTEHQLASNPGAPFPYAPLERPQLAGGERRRSLSLKPLKECLRIRIRLLVKPLLNEGPNVIERMNPGSPSPKSRRSFAVSWTHLTVLPGCREVRNEYG